MLMIKVSQYIFISCFVIFCQITRSTNFLLCVYAFRMNIYKSGKCAIIDLSLSEEQSASLTLFQLNDYYLIS